MTAGKCGLQQQERLTSSNTIIRRHKHMGRLCYSVLPRMLKSHPEKLTVASGGGNEDFTPGLGKGGIGAADATKGLSPA